MGSLGKERKRNIKIKSLIFIAGFSTDSYLETEMPVRKKNHLLTDRKVKDAKQHSLNTQRTTATREKSTETDEEPVRWLSVQSCSCASLVTCGHRL